MEMNRRYLMRLEPDRLLAWYRREAGLTPKAPAYPGWESIPEDSEWGPLPGPILGFYLSAMSMLYESTGDPGVLERLKYTVEELDACQRAQGDGYLLPTVNGRQVFEKVAKGEIVTDGGMINGVAEPTYVMNKIMLGLTVAYTRAGIAQAQPVLIRMADWFGQNVLDKLDDKQLQTLLVCEDGSLNEDYADVYALTGQRQYLDWAKRLTHRAMFDPFVAGNDILDGWHANTQIPKFTGFFRVYQFSGEKDYASAANSFWDTVVRRRSWVIGGNSTDEHFFPASQTRRLILEGTGPETCNSVNMLRLTEALYCGSGEARMADYYERTLYNHILAAHEPERGMCAYYTPMRPGHYRVYSSEFNSFWCCTGTGMESPTKYGAFIYAHDQDGLIVNLFIPSELNWEEMGVQVQQATRFPDEPRTQLTLSLKAPREFAVKIRHPWWVPAGALGIRINGELQKDLTLPSSYTQIRRLWKNGDSIGVDLPMRLSLEHPAEACDYVAVLFGPLVLAGRLGLTGLDHDEFWQTTDYYARKTIPLDEVPALVGDDAEILSAVPRGDGAALEFRITARAPASESSQEIILVPFYRLSYERYAIYWKRYGTQTDWSKERRRLDENRRGALWAQEHTVDWVRTGESISEREHALETVHSETGVAESRHWRRGTDGGWFSYLMKIDRSSAVGLYAEFHGLDEGDFDILIDGHSITAGKGLMAEQTPGIFGEFLRVPTALIEGKDSVTVKFQSRLRGQTRRLFELRTVNGEPPSTTRE
jgi:hypothetical protein